MEHLVSFQKERTSFLTPSLMGRAGWVLFLSFRTLSTVFASTLQTVCYTGGIQRTTHDVITNTRQVFHTTTTHHHDAVLLQVVSLARDVGVHLFLVGQTYTSHLTPCGVRLLRSCSVHTYTHATTLRATVQCRALALVDKFCSSFSN